MSALQKLQLRLRGLEWDRKQLTSRLESTDKKISEVRGEITKALKSGASTGDRLLDMVWRQHERMDIALVDKYAAIEKLMEGRAGEFVLIGYEGEQMTRHTFGQGSEYERVTYFRIGVLGDDKLTFRDRTDEKIWDFWGITLPVTRYIAFQKYHVPAVGKGRCQVTDENILHINMMDHGYPSLPVFVDPELARKASHPFSREPRPGLTTLEIGDKEVRQWFEKEWLLSRKDIPMIYKAAAESLGKLILEPTD